MKATPLQIEQAFVRAVRGESVRSIAREMGVSEGCLRYHFRKGAPPRQIRLLAFRLHQSQLARAMLAEQERAAVDRLMAQHRERAPSTPGR